MQNNNRFTYNSTRDLHLFPKSKKIELHSASIISEQVLEFVRERIDFELTDKQWLVIDLAMGTYWNHRTPGKWICNEDIAGFIFRHCEKEKMLISWERSLKITNKIWEYLIMKRRLVD